jgi:hypothetical protein
MKTNKWKTRVMTETRLVESTESQLQRTNVKAYLLSVIHIL